MEETPQSWRQLYRLKYGRNPTGKELKRFKREFIRRAGQAAWLLKQREKNKKTVRMRRTSRISRDGTETILSDEPVKDENDE